MVVRRREEPLGAPGTPAGAKDTSPATDTSALVKTEGPTLWGFSLSPGWLFKGSKAASAAPKAPPPPKLVLPEKATELPPGVQVPRRSENPYRLYQLQHWVHELTYDAGYDGALVGSERVLLKADAERVDFRALNGIRPERDPATGDKVLFTNGIWTDVPWQQDFMKMIAEHTGNEMIGLHNSTNTMAVDMLQSLTDKVGLDTNKATEALSIQVCQVLRDAKPGETIKLMAFSQGAIVTSNGLSAAKEKLQEHFEKDLKMSRKDATALVEKRMGQLSVTTFGGAAASYPSGPKYEHYVNLADVVPMGTGLGPAAALAAPVGAKPPLVLNNVPFANGPVHLFTADSIPKTDPRYYEAISPAHALPLYLEQWQKVHHRPKSTWTNAQLDPTHRPKTSVTSG